MGPSPRWSWLSTGTIVCARIFPRHGDSLLHVAHLVDEYLIELLDARVLAKSCELGASTSELDFILSRTTPNWHTVVDAAAKGGHLHVFRWMRERQDGRGPWEVDFYFAVNEAARFGHLELVKWLHERGLSCIGRPALVGAAKLGHLEILKWLHEHTTDNTTIDAEMKFAAGRGHLATVQWIYETFPVQLATAMTGAARHGQLNMLQWLHQQQRCSETCSTTVMDAAVDAGQLPVVEWLYENCSKGCSRYAVEQAAGHGNLPMLQWLHKHYSDQFHSDAMDNAAVHGHFETVKWLHEHRSEGCTPHAMDAAANTGHFELVRWLHNNQSEGCTTTAMDYAAGRGRLDIVKWLHENRSEGCTDRALNEAARNGHVDVLQWLVKHYPDKCSDDLMEVAAWGGQFDVVRYLDENTNQRASAWGLGAVAERGRLETLLVLIENSRRNDEDIRWMERIVVCQAFKKALRALSDPQASSVSLQWDEVLESLERFHSHGFHSCVASMLERALLRGYLAVAQRFIGCRDESERCKYASVAAKHRNLVFLRWLLENGTPIDQSSAIQLATECSYAEYVEVAGYLSEGDRVQLVCEAIANKHYPKLMQWTLENTVFNDDSSRAAIRSAIRQAPSDTVQWLRENVPSAEARKWRN